MAKLILGKVVGPEGKAATIEVESTETVAAGSPALVISIHAPVKGATCGSRYHCRRDTISIHIECQIGILGGDKQRVKQLFHSSIAPFR